jgi:hypothetical protein
MADFGERLLGSRVILANKDTNSSERLKPSQAFPVGCTLQREQAASVEMSLEGGEDAFMQGCTALEVLCVLESE